MAVNSSLRERLKIAIPLIIVLTLCIFTLPSVSVLIVGLVLIRSLWEFFNVFKLTQPAFHLPALIYAAIYIFLNRNATSPDEGPITFVGIFGLFVLQLFFPKRKGGMARIAITLTGFIYVITLGCFAIFLYNGDQNGPMLFFSTLFICKFSDAAAFFAGKRFGRKKLIPRVSPNKTVEGLIGAYAGGFLGAPLVYFGIPGVGLFFSLLLCVTIVTVATLGDLFESQFKRELDLKDTANDIPGFGGTLDMIDSILWSMPAAFWLCWACGVL